MSNSSKKILSERKIIRYAYAKLANLSPDIRCTICSNFLSSNFLVPECLHRICGECVEDKGASLMQYKSECPSCRYHIPIKQFLRRDEAFDKMVSRKSNRSFPSAFYNSSRWIITLVSIVNRRFFTYTSQGCSVSVSSHVSCLFEYLNLSGLYYSFCIWTTGGYSQEICSRTSWCKKNNEFNGWGDR